MPLDQIDIDELDEQEDAAEKEMSFMDHLEELRWHILRSAIAILGCAIVIFCFKDFIFNDVIFGPRKDDFWTYRILCLFSETTCFTPAKFNVISTGLTENFVTHMTVSFWMGLTVSFPIVFWEFWRFIKPGLYPKEQNAASGMVFICSALFVIGVLFGYFVVAPLAVSFLASYEIPGTVITPTLERYVDDMVMFTMPMGLIFELPVLVYFLAKIGMISAAFMRDYRRYAVVVLLLIAGFITPSPDIASQMLVFLPLMSLYEIGVLVAQRVEKQRAKEEAMNG
jgi:sec-independent protein translocase protein TatC